VVKANIAALQKGENQVINVGSGEEYHMSDIYNRMLKIIDKKIPLIIESERLGDVRRSVLDVSKAKEIMGWESSVGLDEGIRRTYDSLI
jgi:UDP-glucose 4-epimerase